MLTFRLRRCGPERSVTKVKHVSVARPRSAWRRWIGWVCARAGVTNQRSGHRDTIPPGTARYISMARSQSFPNPASRQWLRFECLKFPFATAAVQGSPSTRQTSMSDDSTHRARAVLAALRASREAPLREQAGGGLAAAPSAPSARESAAALIARHRKRVEGAAPLCPVLGREPSP